MPTTLTSPSIDALNALLQVTTATRNDYWTAIRSIEKGRDGQAIALRAMLRDHARLAKDLRGEIQFLGGKPVTTSGVRGFFSKLTRGLAALLGGTHAVTALRENEAYEMKIARRALGRLDEGRRALVRDGVLPTLREHIQLLDSLMRFAHAG